MIDKRADRERFTKPMADEAQQHLHALVTRRRQLVRLQVSERQRMHVCHADVLSGIVELIDMLKRQVRVIDARIAEHLSQHQADLTRLLQSVKGIGPATTAALIAELPELESAQGQADMRLGGRRTDESGLGPVSRQAHDLRWPSDGAQRACAWRPSLPCGTTR